MKVLVTGGAGFIGSHVVDLLIKKGYSVVVVDNLITGKKEYVNKDALFYKADITDINELSKIFQKNRPEYVFHLAAQVQLRASLKNPIFDATTNILGTLNVLECSRLNNVKKIIYTSTGGARYGDPEELPVKESSNIDPVSPYGISKHTAEHYVKLYNRLYDLDYLIFCFGNVYGPRDDPSSGRVISVFISKMLKNEQPLIFGNGDQTRDFIYVMDLAEFIVNSINKTPNHRLFNLANSEQVSVNKIAELIKKYTDFDKDIKHISAVKGEVKHIFLDIRLAEKELQWKPEHDIEQGIKETVEWFEENI